MRYGQIWLKLIIEKNFKQLMKIQNILDGNECITGELGECRKCELKSFTHPFPLASGKIIGCEYWR